LINESPEALEAAAQRLTALATCLKKHTREVEARRINRMFSTKPSTLGGRVPIRIDPSRVKTEQHWKSIWERET